MDENNKKIVKNTSYLYIRMLVIMALSFITTRVVLDKLGVSDYGINTLVGGFVSMFTVINSILSTGTRRFLALYLGKNEHQKLKLTFSSAFVIHLIIAVVIVIILESFGVWFINNSLNIDENRMYAANWVFQFAVLGVFFSVIQTPYIAAVTAHERFNIYAMMSIYDVFAKLAVLYILVVLPGDKLIIYAALQFLVTFIGLIIYRAYCVRQFQECKPSFAVDKPLLKEMLQFSGWGTLGHVVTVVNSQGISIILNIFFSTVMNAARGLANSVNVIIAQFITGFLTAAQPQLVKYYGAGDMQRFTKLIFNATQYTLFIMALVAVPALLEVDYLIGLWLGGDVPEYTGSFVKITLFCGVIYRSNNMVENGILAAGRAKELNMYSVPVYILSLPLVYFVLWMGWGAKVAYWVGSIPPLISFVINVHLLSVFTGFPGKRFFVHLFLKNILFIIVGAILPFIVQQQLHPGFVRFFVVCTLSLLCTFSIIWFFGLNDEARKLFKVNILGKVIKKYRVES